ncbi:MAG: PEP/pyruvate-binding domain-containing protein [Elusimicrobiota bacterium]|jgi:CheY-like chemotaxis protein
MGEPQRHPHQNLFGDYDIQFGGFDKLMPHRLREVLLVAAPYDSFLLADDDRLTELVFSEYLDLNLRYAPRVTRVSSAKEALTRLREGRRFDIVITMAQVGETEAAAFAREVKSFAPRLPVVLLAFNSLEFSRLSAEEQAAFDRIFLWLGDPRIFMSIIKLTEDRLNIDHDIQRSGVQAVLLVEDSVRFCSAYLPLLYAELMKQTHLLMTEGINLTHKMLRMRARPKILLASSEEEAWALYERYRGNLLGVITDVEFPSQGRLDPEAGLRLAERIKAQDPDMPVLVQSSDTRFTSKAAAVGASFLDKKSPSLLRQLQSFMLNYLGFGEFVFRLEDGREVGRAADLHSLVTLLRSIPASSLEYHSRNNHFSKWLMARTEFELAYRLRPRKLSEFADVEGLRKHLLEAMHQSIHRTQSGAILQFDGRYFDRDSPFVKIGSGSIGGKARGLAFMNFALSRREVSERFPGVRLTVPNTAVLGTDVFEFFVEHNNLLPVIRAEGSNEDLCEAFLRAPLPSYVQKDLETFLARVQEPLAVRSSSMLEDARSQPFAGVYKTYMLPNSDPDPAVRLRQLERAVKLVYASTFSVEARSYLRFTARLPDEEKMAVIIQRIVGRAHDEGRRFYPDISGMAQSYNYYPIEPMQAEDGISYMALGLGKTIMDGYRSLRFSPAHPRSLHQFSTIKDFLDNSQREFLAVDTSRSDLEFSFDAEPHILRLGLEAAEADGTLAIAGSTYSSENDAVYDGIGRPGTRIVSFAPILKNELFPLAEILLFLCDLGMDAMGSHVELEFALTYDPSAQRPVDFNILQMRPMISRRLRKKADLSDADPKRVLCRSSKALGDGDIQDVADILYVKPAAFDAARTLDIAREIGEINETLKREGRFCLLAGPGRWGSADRRLGIPVKWNQISSARAIIETALEGFAVDPSYGAHFFHNVTSLGIGYFTLRPESEDRAVDWDWLSSQPALRETAYLRHVRLKSALDIRIDGGSGCGLILKPREDA